MDVEAMLAHCLAKPGAWPDNPWKHEHPVVKVGPGERGKIFAFLSRAAVGVKAGRSRDEADAWLERYPGAAAVMGYIGRSGWNDLALMDAVDTTYRLVVGGLPVQLRPDCWDAG